MNETGPQPEQSRNLPVASTAQAYPMASPMVGGGGRSFPQANDGEPEGIPWGRYISALKRLWWVAFIVVGLGSGAGYIIAKRSVQEYTAEATIFITSARGGGGAGGAIRPQQVVNRDAWDELLSSYPILDPVARRLMINVAFAPADADLAKTFHLDSVFQPGSYRLTVDPAGKTYTLATKQRAVLEQGTVGDSIGRKLGFLWAPPAALLQPRRTAVFAVSTVRAAAQFLKSKLTTQLPGEDGPFIILRLVGSDPPKIALTLNELVAELVRSSTVMGKGYTTENQRVLQQQLDTATKLMNNAEAALRSFKIDNATQPDGQAPNGNPGLGQMEASRAAAHADRTALEAIVARGPAAINQQAFLAVPGVLTRSEPLSTALRGLTAAQVEYDVNRRRFTDSTPDVIDAKAKVDRLTTETITICRALIASLLTEEQGYAARIGTDSTQLRGIPSRVFEEQRLRRNFTQAEAVYTQVKAELLRVNLADIQTTPDLKSFGEAQTPQFPSSNPGPRLFLLAIIASFGAAIGVVLLIDRQDKHFRHPEQATMELGLTILGTVPKFKANSRGELGVTAQSQMVESFRALRLSLRHHFQDDQPVVFCVSSPGAGEGKSLVSSNLAIAFANSGHKTLLIDGDVRRGVVHATFQFERRPGLVDFLIGAVPAEKVIHPTSTENLSVVTSGARTRRAPELLVSPQLTAFVAEMRQRFDVVIVDSAPFAAGMDSFALGAAAGAMLVVLRPGTSDRNLAAVKLEILDRLPVVVLGAVLNGISGSGAYRYYYSEYSDYEIGDADEELKDDEGPARARLRGPS